MSDQIEFKVSENYLEKFKFAGPRLRSMLASVINKELTATRRSINEELQKNTLLKRKMLNDRMILRRASPNNLSAAIIPIFGDTNILLSDFPFTDITVNETGSTTKYIDEIRSQSPLYDAVTFKTAHLSKNGNILMREDGKRFQARGKTLPGMFQKFDIQARFGNVLQENVTRAIDDFFKGL